MKNIILFTLLLISTLSFSIEKVGSEEGDIAPILILENLDSKTILGKPTIVKFWQSTCPPCLEETSSLKRFYKNNKDDINLIYIAINKDADSLYDYLSEEKIYKDLPVYFDKERYNAGRYQVKRTPTTFILNERGIITYRWSGIVDWDKVTVDKLKSFPIGG